MAGAAAYREARQRARDHPEDKEAVAEAERRYATRAAGGEAGGAAYREAQQRAREHPEDKEAVAEADLRLKNKQLLGLRKLGPLTHKCTKCGKQGSAGTRCRASDCYGSCRTCLACKKMGVDNDGKSCKHHKLKNHIGNEIGFAEGQTYDNAANKEAMQAGVEARQEIIDKKNAELKDLEEGLEELRRMKKKEKKD